MLFLPLLGAECRAGKEGNFAPTGQRGRENCDLAEQRSARTRLSLCKIFSAEFSLHFFIEKMQRNPIQSLSHAPRAGSLCTREPRYRHGGLRRHPFAQGSHGWGLISRGGYFFVFLEMFSEMRSCRSRKPTQGFCFFAGGGAGERGSEDGATGGSSSSVCPGESRDLRKLNKPKLSIAKKILHFHNFHRK